MTDTVLADTVLADTVLADTVAAGTRDQAVTEDPMVDVLLWAAGGTRPLPDLTGLDVEELAQAVALHRLDARLLARAERDGAELPLELVRRVTAQHRANVERMHRHIDLFRRVRDRLEERAPGTGLIPLKGFGLYALTGSETHTAFSHDVDVIGGDPRAVADAVESMGGSGYHYHGEEHPYVFAHMDEVEVHARYIVTGFPRDAGSTLTDVTTTGGVVRIAEPFRAAAIEHAQMAPLLIPGTGPAHDLRVPRPELALLIRCAHVYVGFAMNTQPIPWATVRLEELVQMRDLIRLPGFDDRLFDDLARRFEADLVIDFARVLHRRLLGSDPFEGLAAAREEPREVFPRNLWWDGSASGFPVQLPWQPTDVVRYRSDDADLVDVLGGPAVTLGDGIRFELGGAASSSPVARYVWHAFGGGVGELTATLTPGADGLRAEVRFPRVREGQMAAVGWASGQFRYEVFYRPGGPQPAVDDYSANPVAPQAAPRLIAAETDAASAGRIELEFPWSALGLSGPRAGAGLPLVLQARVQGRPWGSVAGGAVAPLRVVL